MKALLQQRVRQFLVHSFLYYQLHDSVISDSKYDHLCQELQNLLQQYPDDVPFRNIVEQTLGGEASGFSIKKYPPAIISAAFHLLYQHRYLNSLDFIEFVERFGYRHEFFSND